MRKRKIPITDIAIIGGLFVLMLLWGPVYQRLFPPPPESPASALTTNAPPKAIQGTNTPAPAEQLALRPATPEVSPSTGVTVKADIPLRPEQTLTVSNALLSLTVSSHGGAIKDARLDSYALTPKSASPVVLDYAGVPALRYEGIPGLDAASDFKLVPVAPGVARMEAAGTDGITLIRTITATNGYSVLVQDTFVNTGSAPASLAAHAITLGSMSMLTGETSLAGVDLLGIDTLPSTGGEKVRHWASKRFFSDDLTIVNFFDEEPRRGHGCIGRPAMTHPLPRAIRESLKGDMDWAAVKNKFFVQILAPQKESATGCDLIAERIHSPGEDPANSRSWDSVAVPNHVAAALRFGERQIPPGERFTRTFSYYVGPKELSTLEQLGNHQKEVMDFGMFRWLCEVLLLCLNWLYKLIPNYGVAIILLTLIVRVIFWPLTHKGTESMKKMQALQPKLMEIREKYKDKPQKMQQETMALYREHKVNPVGGCLPMLIQIPVFFALFVVLRSAVELRFAPFLWISDLTAPENLFAGMIPIVGSLNILPLVMAATQAWQQALTPTAGDPAQQKMMMFMPVIMLLFLYSMPSALVLYWTANQVLMIIQLLWQKRGKT